MFPCLVSVRFSVLFNHNSYFVNVTFSEGYQYQCVCVCYVKCYSRTITRLLQKLLNSYQKTQMETF